MTTDLYDATEELDPYYIDRDASSPRGRLWAVEKAIITLAAAGLIDVFKGSGSDPTGLTGYSTSKLWLRVDDGVTTAPGTLRVYDGSGTASLLASWPTLASQGLSGVRQYLSVYSKAEIVDLLGGGTTLAASQITNDSSVSGTKVKDALNTLNTALSGKVSTSALGVTVATLSGGKVPSSQLPANTLDIAGLTALSGALDISADRIPIYDASGTANAYISATDILKGISSLLTDAAPVMSTDYLLSYDASASTAKKVLMKNIGAGKQSIWLPAGSWRAVTTGTKTAATNTTAFDSGTNDLTFPVLTFSGTVDNYAWTNVIMPPAWDRSSVSFLVVQTNTAVGTGNNVWSLGGFACGDNETFDGAPTSTSITVTGTAARAITTNITSSESSSLVISGSPQALDHITLQLLRPAATNAADTNTANINFVGLLLYYTTSQNTDG